MIPCNGDCLVTIINEVGIRPYGEFYYELVSNGRNSLNQIIGLYLNIGLIHGTYKNQNANMNVLYVEGKIYKLGSFEWEKLHLPEGEHIAFHERLNLKSIDGDVLC